MKVALAITLAALAAFTASSSPAGGPLPCTALRLEARGGLQGATKALEGGVTVTNRRAYPCMLGGRTKVEFIRGGVPISVSEVPGRSTTGRRDPRVIMLSAGERAFVRLRWSNWCGRRYASLGILLRLRANQQRLIVRGTTSVPPCVNRRAASVVAVGPWERR